MKNYIFKKKSLKMTSLHIVFDAGSRTEKEGQHGTMHLMEHLICKTFKDLYKKLSELGIRWNAFTNTECVTVYFEGLDKYLTPELKQELYSRITGGLDCVSEEDFSNERNVVLQEYMDNVFDSNGASWMKVMRRWWGDYLTIGNKPDIENFTYEDMKNAYEERFAHATRVVEVGRKSTEFFTKLEYRGIDKEENKYRFGKRKDIEDVEVASNDKTSVFLFSRKRVNRSDYPFLHIGIEMLTNGLESPYYTELREKLGLTYYVYGDFIRNHSNGVMVINACTDTENAEKLKNRMRELIEQTETLLSEERYDTIMSNIRIGREKNDALLFQDPWRYTAIGNLKLPPSLERLTYDKVVKTTLKYMKHAVIVTSND